MHTFDPPDTSFAKFTLPFPATRVEIGHHSHHYSHHHHHHGHHQVFYVLSDESGDVFCCGSPSHKYCCTRRDQVLQQEMEGWVGHLGLGQKVKQVNHIGLESSSSSSSSSSWCLSLLRQTDRCDRGDRGSRDCYSPPRHRLLRLLPLVGHQQLIVSSFLFWRLDLINQLERNYATQLHLCKFMRFLCVYHYHTFCLSITITLSQVPSQPTQAGGRQSGWGPVGAGLQVGQRSWNRFF